MSTVAWLDGVVYCPYIPEVVSGSYGEQKIQQLLNEFGVKYVKEWVIKDLHSDKGFPLRFDVCVPEVKLAIEYDGSQHFKQSTLFHESESDFNRQKLHDAMKTEWAQKNGWSLLRFAKTDLDDLDGMREVLEMYLG